MAVSDILDLGTAKAFLNITSTDADVEVAQMVSAASTIIAGRIGPVAGSPTFTEFYDGGGPQIVLRHTPVQSVTKITEAWGFSQIFTLNPTVLDGSVTDLGYYGYSLNTLSGLITRRAAGSTIAFAAGLQNVIVTYVAGYAVVPEDIKLACGIILQDMYSTQRGGSTRPGQPSEAAMPGARDAIPPRAAEILNSYYVPGIA